MKLSRFPTSAILKTEAPDGPVKARLRMFLNSFDPKTINVPPMIASMIPLAKNSILSADEETISKYLDWFSRVLAFILRGEKFPEAEESAAA